MRRIFNWLKSEESVSEGTTTGMLVLAGILVAVGLGWLVMNYLKSSGHTTLQNMTDISNDGIDPDTPPHVVEGWE